MVKSQLPGSTSEGIVCASRRSVLLRLPAPASLFLRVLRPSPPHVTLVQLELT